jgi:HAD superfamily hydrolase (TIGR01459 family)
MGAIASLDEILARYDVLLFDAYGVLVHADGALPGASELLSALRAEGRETLILTNDASRTPEQCAARYRDLGLDVDASMVISSGSLLAGWYAAESLVGTATIVLGPAGSRTLVERAGGVPISPAEARSSPSLVVALCDEAFEPFLPLIDDTLSAVLLGLQRGAKVRLVVPNPDLLYPRGGGGFGLTTGAVAHMFEAALAAKLGSAPRFERLGKPHPPMFEEARRRSRGARLVMFGDTLETDILGAARAGIDSVLVRTGVSAPPAPDAALQPTWVLRSLVR